MNMKDAYVFLNDEDTFSPAQGSVLLIDGPLRVYSIEKMYSLLSSAELALCEVPVTTTMMDSLSEDDDGEGEE
jgi:hypothetical protein